MVAYSFKPMFAPQIERGTKRWTVRGPRRRHAKPGEALQLFTGMRTRNCRKITETDPVCSRVMPIRILVSDTIDQIEFPERGLTMDTPASLEQFANLDGFDPADLSAFLPGAEGRTSRDLMGEFWRKEHGVGLFDGVLIEWEWR